MTTGSTLPIVVMLADDDPDDCLLARDALAAGRNQVQLRVTRDGEDLMDYLHRRGAYQDPATAPRPQLILLDLSMPRKSGLEALAEIKATPALRQIPVIIMTTSSQDEEICRSYDLGASSFVTKPVRFETLVDVMNNIDRYWFQTVELPE
ncbi:MAG: response regulator [Acidobacteriota bacterium]|nr:response regulator [Acidobacteriota bacterium]